MTSTKFTRISRGNKTVNLKENSFPTLAGVNWGTFPADNAGTVDLNSSTPDTNNVVWFLGGNANQKITGKKNSKNVIDGGAGADTINGGDLDDFLYGGDGNDSLNGGAGNDRLAGGDNNDTLLGGAGDDWLWGDNGNDRLVGGVGSDTINGGTGNDTIYGDEATNTANGTGSADVIFAGDGNDSVWGGAGDDFLYGEAGNDALNGGRGADTLVGGAGADTMTGYWGNDAFVFRIADAKDGNGNVFTDTITDFKIGEDTIWLDWANYETSVTTQKPLNVDATSKDGGTLLKFDFMSNGTGTDYQIFLQNISLGSLGTGQTFQDNLKKMFIVYDNSDVTFRGNS